MAPSAARAQASFKLLAPGTGWAANSNGLYWTSDGGAHWSDITPHLATGEEPGGLCSTFFLDRSTGWVLFCSDVASGNSSEAASGNLSSAAAEQSPEANSSKPAASADSKPASGSSYRLASTSDGGATWSVKDLAVPGIRHNFPQLGRGSLSFADPLQGWINFDLATGEHSGYLIRTEDGGRTWSIVGGAGAGPVLFRNGAVGWSLWPSENTLFSTRNGASTWEEVVLKRPALPFPENIPMLFTVPTYTDARHALLPVLYRPAEGSSKVPQIVLYSSDDDGQHWTPVRLLPAPGAASSDSGDRSSGATSNNPEAAISAPVATIADKALLLATLSDDTLTLTTLSLSHSGPVTVNADLAPPAPEGSRAGSAAATRAEPAAKTVAAAPRIQSLSFLNTREGWVSTSSAYCAPAARCTQLLATTDGGATWTKITPPSF